MDENDGRRDGLDAEAGDDVIRDGRGGNLQEVGGIVRETFKKLGVLKRTKREGGRIERRRSTYK